MRSVFFTVEEKEGGFSAFVVSKSCKIGRIMM